MLPTSLRLVYALNSATFQVSSLALLSIVNTRVSIPATYLPAYGAISFLPYSLRPIFAWISSLILRVLDKRQQQIENSSSSSKNRHDKLLCPAFILASLSFIGTIFIPSTNGVILCFVWGFMRGVAGAWTDFLIGMSVIEFSKLQSKSLHLSSSSSTTTSSSSSSYEQIVSINTAQSSTAKNVGSFIASVATFIFFARNSGNIGERVANTLLFGTAVIFLVTSLTSLKYQFHVNKLLANDMNDRYDTIDDNDVHVIDDVDLNDEVESSTEDAAEIHDTTTYPDTSSHQQQIIQVSTLISFQILLAVSALQKPIIAISNQTVWVTMVITFAIILICTICIGYKYEQNEQQQNASLTTTDTEMGRHDRLSHRNLNLYFLLRYSMPIAGFIMYSYLYTVFESEPLFLQLLSVLKSAIGILSTYYYERYLSPKCHSGWQLIGLIASLDIVTGLVALFDVWVVRAVRAKEIDGEYSIDTSLRFLVAIVSLAKYFFAELDYQPALVLSTTNIYNNDDDDDAMSWKNDCDNLDDEGSKGEEEERQSASLDDFQHQQSNTTSSLSIDLYQEENGMMIMKQHTTPNNTPMISAGMQYASFLSCIDFGAQIGDWIAVPIVSSLDITRENHWDHLDSFIILCSIFRMSRVVFLWLICPPVNK